MWMVVLFCVVEGLIMSRDLEVDVLLWCYIVVVCMGDICCL